MCSYKDESGKGQEKSGSGQEVIRSGLQFFLSMCKVRLWLLISVISKAKKPVNECVDLLSSDFSRRGKAFTEEDIF